MRILTEAQHARLENPGWEDWKVVGWNERLHGPIVRVQAAYGTSKAYTVTARGRLTRARGHDDG